MENSNPYNPPKTPVGPGPTDNYDLPRVAKGKKLIIYSMIVVGIIVILAAVALPVPWPSTTRSKISEALLAASACRNSVTETAQESSVLPASGFWGCESSASGVQVSEYVKSIKTSSAAAAPGTIQVVITGVNTTTNGMAILLQPSSSATGFTPITAGTQIASWICGPDPTNPAATPITKYLPQSCRGSPVDASPYASSS